MLPATELTLELDRACKAASIALRALSGDGPMGLTPDSVRSTDEWKSAKLAYDRAFSALRAHNAKRRIKRAK